MLKKTDYEFVLDKISKDKYVWCFVPSEGLSTPEFIDCYQSQFSILNSQCLGKNNQEFYTNSNIQNRIRYNNLVLKQLPEFFLIDKVRQFLNINSPFGKVSLWKILSTGKVNEHTDRWPYHFLIDRYILNLNLNNKDCDIIVNDKKIDSDPGSIIPFSLNDKHKLINNQKETIYFLAIDIFKS